MTRSFGAKLGDDDSARLQAALGERSFGSWVRAQLEASETALRRDGIMREIETGEERLEEVAAELEQGEELVEQRRAAEALIEAKVEAAEALFARAVEGEIRLAEFNQAAVGMRRFMAAGDLLRRMSSPDEAGTVEIPEMIESVLQPIANWLHLTGNGEAVAVRAPQAVRAKHTFTLEWELTAAELVYWLAAVLWSAEHAEAAPARP